MTTAGDPAFSPWRHRFAVFTAACTLALIFVGGLVTSTGSGLAVPDWPLSYGMLMPPMVGGVFFEHGHRMVATFVGLLTTILAVWTARSEPRAGVRRLAWVALAAVVAQGILGGITVKFLLPTPVSVTHACLAQTFFCMTIALAYSTSREFLAGPSSDPDRAHVGPAAILATAVVFLQLAVGAVILTISLINTLAPAFRVNALLAKNLIYFFGHVFINSTIYMAVIGVYEILPTFTGRPWKSSKPFLLAWTATMLMVLAVYPHHLFMDYAQPTWAAVLGQVLSYTSSLPVLAVTAAATLASVYRSGMKWNLTAGLLFAAVMGWSVGVIPAVVDGTIAINRVMHNTLWVPGHFHTYLLLGVVAMLFGFMYFLGLRTGASDSALDRAGFWMYVIGSLAFASAFLAGGAMSIPRRWAIHLEPWLTIDKWGALFALVVVVGAVVFVAKFLGRVRAVGA